MTIRLVPALVLALLLSGCGGPDPSQKALAALIAEFTGTALSFSPASATAAGYHRHGTLLLDELLDDYSPGALDRRRLFFLDLRRRLERDVKLEELTPQESADAAILGSQIGLALLELERIRAFRHDPTVYTERIRTALFTPFTVEYAPWPERARHIIRRVEQVPEILKAARTNLVDSAEIRLNAALEEVDGNIALIDKAIRPAIPAPLAADYDRAADSAIAALDQFGEFLTRDMARRGEGEWRLGPELYALQFRDAVGPGTPTEVLAAAEADLAAIETATGGLARQLAPSPKEAPVAAGENLEQLRRIVEHVRGSQPVPFPPRNSLRIMELPESLSTSPQSGYLEPAPPLEPGLHSFLRLPRACEVRKGRGIGPCRDRPQLQATVLRETGRYVQSEFANRVEPASRRLLRTMFGSREYKGGWALYASEMLLKEGALEDSPELRFAVLERQARTIAGTIVEIRLHTLEMTENEALELLRKRAHQSPGEAVETLRLVELSPCRLPAELLGWRKWKRARDRYRALRGEAFHPREFHERALRCGPVPMAALDRILAASLANESSK